MPVGFPATETGIEIRILKQLFTPAEVRVALALGMLLEPVSAIHRRLGGEPDLASLTTLLESMARRGLIRSSSGHEYGKLPFVVGIYEGQVDRMTPQLARDMLEYFDGPLGRAIAPKATPQLRAVPVNQAIAVERDVSTYDDIRASIAKSAGPFAVMNCICRQANDLAGHPCRQTDVRENCLTMGSAAEMMIVHGQARPITRERMFELLDEADREGLVLQPQNTRNPIFVCLCCGCCCVALKAGKQSEKPAVFFNTNYHVDVDQSACEGCGTCLSRYQMDALSMDAGAAVVELVRCIGCGLCVTTCPSGAIRLMARPDVVAPPPSTEALYARIFRERYGTAAFARTAARLLARRLR